MTPKRKKEIVDFSNGLFVFVVRLVFLYLLLGLSRLIWLIP